MLAVRSCRAGGCFTCEGGVTVSPSGWIVLIAWHSGHATCAIETPPSDLATAQSRPKTSTRSLALCARQRFANWIALWSTLAGAPFRRR